MLTKEEEIYLAVLIAVSFLALILVFFIINLIYNQRKIRRLQKALISAEIVTLENERRRYSQDLHDEIGPNLSAVLLYAGGLETMDDDGAETKQKIEEIVKITLLQIRTIAKNIIPRYIQEHGLKASLETMTCNFNQALDGKTKIALDICSAPTELNEFDNLNIYRIVQEAINNAIKHGECSEIRVHVSVIDNKISMGVSDNGKGFEYAGMIGKLGAGIGLKNIQNRVISLGGQLNIYSQKGKGTQILAEIPLL